MTMLLQEAASGTGCIIALKVPDDTFAKYALPDDGETTVTPPEAHVTLLWLGKELTQDQIQDARRVCWQLASRFKPFDATISGIGHFAASDAFYLSIDSLPLGTLREYLRVMLPWTAAGQTHGFQPHTTVKMLAPGEALPYQSASMSTWQVDAIELWQGAVHERFPLMGSLSEAAVNLEIALLEGQTFRSRRAP